jgi:hypothetical protein
MFILAIWNQRPVQVFLALLLRILLSAGFAICSFPCSDTIVYIPYWDTWQSGTKPSVSFILRAVMG